MTEPETSLALIVPDPKLVVANWKAFDRLKRAILHDDDYALAGGTRVIKRGGWRKLAAALNISVTLSQQERIDYGNGNFAWSITVEATAPSGRSFSGVASCASNERRYTHPEHDVRGVAFTRAANRAISDLIGGGGLSAEEMQEEQLGLEEAAKLVTNAEQALQKEGLTCADFTFVIELVRCRGDIRQAYRQYLLSQRANAREPR